MIHRHDIYESDEYSSDMIWLERHLSQVINPVLEDRGDICCSPKSSLIAIAYDNLLLYDCSDLNQGFVKEVLKEDKEEKEDEKDEDSSNIPMMKNNQSHRYDSTKTIAWNVDGSLLASCVYQEDVIQIWDMGTKHCIKKIAGVNNSPIFFLQWSQDEGSSSLLLFATKSCMVIVDVLTGNHLLRFNHDKVFVAIAWSHDHSKIVTSSIDKSIHVWEVASFLMKSDK